MRSLALRGSAQLLLVWALVSCLRALQAAEVSDVVAKDYRVEVNGTAILVYGTGTSDFNPGDIPSDESLYNTTQHIGLHGVVLPDQFPASWSRFKALRSLVIDCSPPAGAGSGGGSGSSKRGFFGNVTQLESLKGFIQSKEGVSVDRVSILDCGMQGVFSQVWKDYLNGVPRVNLSGNALTGGFTAIDDFDGICTDDFAGDDYASPDCSSPDIRLLDVTRNALSGDISSGAALGDDVTDALCSSGCLSIVLHEGGLRRDEVMCMAPLVVLAMSNPGLRFPRGTLYASGYVVGDRANWCFEPASRWVLPTMWGVFLALLVATLGVTLYARLRLKRVPFRMTNTSSFDVLGRSGLAGSSDSLHHAPHATASAASPRSRGASGAALGAYSSLPDGSIAIELAERQAMVPKSGPHLGRGGASFSSPREDEEYEGDEPPQRGRRSNSLGGGKPTVKGTERVYVSAAAVGAPLPLSSQPSEPGAGAGDSNGGGGIGVHGSSSGTHNGGGGGGGGGGNSRWVPRKFSRGAGRDEDKEGMRAALTAGLVHSGRAVGSGSAFVLDSDQYDESDPDASGRAGGSGGGGRRSRGASADGGAGGIGLGGRSSHRGGSATREEGPWRVWFRALLMRALEILWMQLRTLLVLGMFGLECYWAYSLILYRGGWQLLVLIPNYLEHTLGGIAMLRAFLKGTHGRWKYVAAVPLLPFTMASTYLIYGFVAYPFGWADLGPVSWEKFIDLMDSCGVLSSTCWAIFSSLAYWRGNSVSTSYQYFNTDIFVGMMLMCFTDLLSTAHHLASTLQLPFKQWLLRELDVRREPAEPQRSLHLQGDGDL